MKQFFKSLLDENTSVSSQRFSLLVCLFLTVTLVTTVIILVFQKADINYIKELSFLIFGILTVGTGMKMLQRFGERENNSEQNKVSDINNLNK